MGFGVSQDRKGVADDENQMELPLMFTHTYDTVEINTAVPWDELDDSTQLLARKVVDYYRMQASVRVDAQVTIKSITLESDDKDMGVVFSLVAAVEPLGDKDIDYESLFIDDDDEDDE